MSDIRSLGSRRELFVDHYLVETLDGCDLRLNPPERREVVFQVEHPGENACTACYNLTRNPDDDRILLYYRGFYPIGERLADWAESQTANLAFSDDGVHFERPSLGLVEFEGSRDNNIFYRGYEAHNFLVFRDDNPAADPQQRFKAVGGSAKNRLYGFTSADGVHWNRLQEEPLDITGAFDSANVPLWDPHARCYRLFSRYFEEIDGQRVRAIQSCTSEDFVHWTDAVPHQYAEGVELEQFYTNATVPCPGAEHLLISCPKRFFPERVLNTEGMDYPGEGLSDAAFMTSRDGVHWDRTFRQAWVRPGLDQRNWTHRNCTPAVGILETAPDEWSMYISEHYGWDDNRLRRLAVPPHRFASLHADVPGGEVLTPPLTFEGGELYLNFATSSGGSVQAEILGADGRPLPGYRLEDSPTLYGDALSRAVRWAGDRPAGPLSGQAVRLRLVLRDADVYALQFT